MTSASPIQGAVFTVDNRRSIGFHVPLDTWMWPPRARDVLKRLAAFGSIGEMDLRTVEMAVGGLLRQCPQRLRGKTADAMIRFYKNQVQEILDARIAAGTRIAIAARQMFIRERPREDIIIAAIEANAGVLPEDEAATVLREEWLVFQNQRQRRQQRPQGRGKRWG